MELQLHLNQKLDVYYVSHGRMKYRVQHAQTHLNKRYKAILFPPKTRKPDHKMSSLGIEVIILSNNYFQVRVYTFFYFFQMI